MYEIVTKCNFYQLQQFILLVIIMIYMCFQVKAIKKNNFDRA